jgi:hypothetical protein
MRTQSELHCNDRMCGVNVSSGCAVFEKMTAPSVAEHTPVDTTDTGHAKSCESTSECPRKVGAIQPASNTTVHRNTYGTAALNTKEARSQS